MGNERAESRCGIVAVVGRANVGKSTLLNAILEEKVSIVSPVAQTTRNVVRGILTEGRGQLVFLDTPGVHKAAGDLGRIMNQSARKAIEGADVVLLVLDSSVPPQLEDDGWMRRLHGEACTVVAVLNKRDHLNDASESYRDLWRRVGEEKRSTKDAVWLSTSALRSEGITDLVDTLFTSVPASPLLFPEDVLTDFPRKLAIGDVIREKYFLVLRDELPHSLAVEVQDVEEADDGSWQVKAQILVDKPSQKGIVIGQKGRLLRRVRRNAEKELADMYERPVTINMWVKIEKNWTKNFWMLQRLGYRT